MKTDRLTILVAIMVAALVLRVALPSTSSPPALAEPIVRHPLAMTATPTVGAPPAPTQLVAATTFVPNDPDDDMPGNAFAVKGPPVSATPVPIPAVVAAPPPPMQIQPSLPPPPPPVPLQVIGTFDDGHGPAVFLAGPGGTVLARQGTVVLATYRVTAIDARQVSLVEEATQRATQLSIPTGPAR